MEAIASTNICSVCGKTFTESEWDNRHTDPSDNLGDCHEYCCSKCNIEKCEQCEVEGEELTDGRCWNCRDIYSGCTSLRSTWRR